MGACRKKSNSHNGDVSISGVKPVIAITKPSNKDRWAFAAIAMAVRLCGGEPVALTPREQRQKPMVNGLIFGGGQDIFPMLYDATPKQGYLYDRDRDALEIEVAKLASKYDIPSLGICRGAQMMNVMRGGALHADVSAEYEDAAYPNGVWDKIFYRKLIRIEENSLMRDILKETETTVNSLHKQSVKRLGKGLRATAMESNGVIQAVEDNCLTFFIGVQFHPELLIYRKDMRAIFQRLVDEAAKRDPVELSWEA